MVFKVERLSPETFLVNGNKYYVEYMGSDFCDKITYRIIDLSSPHKLPIRFTTNYDLHVLPIPYIRFTQEQAAVCIEKGMQIEHYMIRKPRVKIITQINSVLSFIFLKSKSLYERYWVLEDRFSKDI